MEKTGELNWYAFRMRGRSPREAQQLAAREGFDTYYALRKFLKDDSYETSAEEAFDEKALMPTVIFVRCTVEFALRMRNNYVMWPFCLPGSRTVCPISQREMEIFRATVESGCRNLEVIDLELVVGDKVRVLDGMFKGQEGHIVKIRGDKRFVVTIPGVVALATIYIPRHLLTPA